MVSLEAWGVASTTDLGKPLCARIMGIVKELCGAITADVTVHRVAIAPRDMMS